MPYGIRKSPNKNLYWVYNKESGKKFSKKPIPRERAEAQRRAIYASENGYKLNRSRSRSLRGGNRFKRSLKSLREKLRQNEIERNQELFVEKYQKFEAQRQLEALYDKLELGITKITFSNKSEEKKDLYKVTYIQENVFKNWLFDRFGLELDYIRTDLINGSTLNDPVNDYIPLYFKKNLEMPDIIHLPESVKQTLKSGLKLDNWYSTEEIREIIHNRALPQLF